MTDGCDRDGGEDDHVIEKLTFTEAHRRVGAGSRLPGECTEDPTPADAAHWVDVYGELVRFKHELLAVAHARRGELSIDASLEGAADEALLTGQLHRYEQRLEEWQTAPVGRVRAPSDGHHDGPLLVEGPVQRLGDLVIDPRQRVVVKDGRRLELTPSEWKLLRVFLEHPDRNLTREQLAEWAWGSGFGSRAGEVEVYVSRLRRKVETLGSPRLIQTVRGTGYRLVTPGGVHEQVLGPACHPLAGDERSRAGAA
jgi:DNA-binding winged helix-turn-helix (wHTH) protein